MRGLSGEDPSLVIPWEVLLHVPRAWGPRAGPPPFVQYHGGRALCPAQGFFPGKMRDLHCLWNAHSRNPANPGLPHFLLASPLVDGMGSGQKPLGHCVDPPCRAHLPLLTWASMRAAADGRQVLPLPDPYILKLQPLPFPPAKGQAPPYSPTT